MSVPTSPKARPRSRLATPRLMEAPSRAETVVKASTISAKYSAGPNSSASLTKSGARKVSARVPSVPATKEPMAAVASAAAPRPLPRHQVSLDRGHDRTGFARRIEQDGGGRTAIHGAVIEAGKHDEGAGGIEVARDRQEKRDGERRADAGQDADERAKRHADQRPHEIDRRDRRGKAIHQGKEGRPSQSNPFKMPGGSCRPRPWVKPT